MINTGTDSFITIILSDLLFVLLTVLCAEVTWASCNTLNLNSDPETRPRLFVASEMASSICFRSFFSAFRKPLSVNVPAGVLTSMRSVKINK